MTKNKTAICTPTATREEFESILRELDGVGVKWESGDPPLDPWCLGYYYKGCYLSYRWEGKPNLVCGGFKSKKETFLPRAEFIAAIKRDFGKSDISKMETTGEEQPKMNYKTMLKKDLIKEIERLLYDERENSSELAMIEAELNKAVEQRNTARATADKYGKQCASIEKSNTELKAKWTKQDEANNKAFGECANLKEINRELLGDTKKLEKANAEQAETIRDLNSRLLSSEGRNIKTHDRLTKEAQKAYKAQHENIRIKRLAAQILCADVLEGK